MDRSIVCTYQQATEELNMETYIQVSFWLGITALVINMIRIAAVDYPNPKVETLGGKVFEVLINAGFLVWAGFLLFSN
jgi:hypothetical protein